MRKSVFITGATGFIGRALVCSLVATGKYDITALVRHAPDRKSNELKWVVGDLLDPVTYQSSLQNVHTVIHLAAATGSASRYEHELINVEGTRKLLEAAKTAAVHRLIYISTIVVTFSDQRWYPYAQTKKRAEALVRESGIPSIVLRPTIVLGRESPIWRSLCRFASLPIVLAPNGGRTNVQPIYIADLVYGIEQALAQRQFRGEVLDLGGPVSLSFAQFLRAIHKGLKGKQPWLFPVPLFPIRAALRLLESVARPVLPITAGQLALFANDSTVTSNWLHDLIRCRMRSLEEVIHSIVPGAPEELAASQHFASTASSPSPVEPVRSELIVFTRYLTNMVPTEYVGEQYRMALLAHNLAHDADFSAFDCSTLNLARRGAWCTRFADAYCAIFRRHGAMRRRLIMLMAILEHTAPYSDGFDRPTPRSMISSCTGLLLQGVQFTLSFMVGAALLLPVHLVFLYRAARETKGTNQ
jgi:nucleoside-diphosphate-sugar epimerase